LLVLVEVFRLVFAVFVMLVSLSGDSGDAGLRGKISITSTFLRMFVAYIAA
jgi:hypothetical protein